MTTQNLDSYVSAIFAKDLVVAEAKAGKTCSMMANILGGMPWQEHGGIVDKPSSLHVIAFDSAAVDGVRGFLIDTLGMSKEVGQVHIENLQDEARKAFASGEYNGTFLGKVYEALDKCQTRAVGKGTHVIMFSSLTMCAKGVLRSISGPAYAAGDNGMKKSPMDRNKWGLFKQQMTELQYQAQQDKYHVIWEGHLGEKITEEKDSVGKNIIKDTIQVDGSFSETFPANVEHIYKMKRKAGQRYVDPKTKKPTKCDLVEFDTQPSMDFGGMMSGRKVNELLDPKEPDMTLMYHKLGLRIGGYGT